MRSAQRQARPPAQARRVRRQVLSSGHSYWWAMGPISRSRRYQLRV